MKDKTKNILLLITQILITIASVIPFIFKLNKWEESLYDHKFYSRRKIINLFGLNENGNFEPSFSLPSPIFYFMFYIMLLLVLVLIIINFKKRVLFPLIFGVSLLDFIIYIIICYTTTAKETKHFTNTQYLDHNTELLDKYKYNMETGAYIIILLFIAITVIALISSIPLIKKYIAKSRENKLNRQKAFENMANYTNVPQQADQNITSDHVFCTNCGYRNLLQARFCRRCGQKIE